MSDTYLREHTAHMTALLTPLTAQGHRLYRLTPDPATDFDALWLPLRPACQVWRVPRSAQRWLESQLRQEPEAWRLHWDGRWQHLLVAVPWCLAHVLPYGEHPACIAYNVWHSQVMYAFMTHGTYAPERNHEPAPGEELDAIERREAVQAKFDECFPWFKTLPRYRIVRDDAGNTYAEEMPSSPQENDDAGIF